MRLSLQVASLAMPRIGFRPFLRALSWFCHKPFRYSSKESGFTVPQNFSGGSIGDIGASRISPVVS